MSLDFSPATLQQVNELMAIELAAQQFPMTERVMASCFGSRYFNWLARQGSQVVGFYIGEYVAGEASLIEICVCPDHQGLGYGRALLEHFIEQARRQGGESCWLEVRASNTSAQRLYLSRGFNELDRRKGYYPAADGREDALLMSLWIGD